MKKDLSTKSSKIEDIGELALGTHRRLKIESSELRAKIYGLEYRTSFLFVTAIIELIALVVMLAVILAMNWD